MKWPSVRTVLATSSSLFYCIRQFVSMARVCFPVSMEETDFDESVESTVSDINHGINNVAMPIVEHFEDGQLTSEELSDIVNRLEDLRKHVGFKVIAEDREL
jgi:benzoyl-CoA reductase/2-hydroxyglutaryl-CoA dehydratase subunit BcrC/BadD/HgdB